MSERRNPRVGNQEGVGGNTAPQNEVVFDHQVHRLELPLFGGEDSTSKIFWVKRYFVVNQIKERDRILVTIVCTKGLVLTWLQWAVAKSPITNWDIFKQALIERFRPSQEGTIIEELLSLQQLGALAEYQSLFKRLLALRDLFDELLKELLPIVWWMKSGSR